MFVQAVSSKTQVKHQDVFDEGSVYEEGLDKHVCVGQTDFRGPGQRQCNCVSECSCLASLSVSPGVAKDVLEGVVRTDDPKSHLNGPARGVRRSHCLDLGDDVL